MTMPPTLASMLAIEFGTDFEDLTAALPTNPGVPPYARRAVTDISMIVLHHTEAASSVPWQSVAIYHVEGNKWPGIGYHIGIRDHGGVCKVSLLNEPESCSYHAHQVGNSRGLAICVAGKKDVEPVTPAELDALARFVSVMRRWAAWRDNLPVIGHGQVPGNQTTCPGRYLKETIPVLNETVIDDQALSKRIWEAAKSAQILSPNPGSATEVLMREQGYQQIGNEVDVLDENGRWVGVTALGYYPGGNANGVAFFATNLGPSGQWQAHIVEMPE